MINNFLKGLINRPNALIAFAIFSFIIAYTGYELGKTTVGSKPQITIISSFLALDILGISFLNAFIDAEIKTEKEKVPKLISENSNQRKIDFLSYVQEKISLNESIVGTELYQDGETTAKLEYRLNNNLNDLKIADETLNNLVFTYIKDPKTNKDVEILKILVAKAIKDQLGKSLKDKDNEFDRKCDHLYAYLRGWLICGIKYHTKDLPVEWIKNTALNKNELIKVIKYVKDLVLNHQKVQENIPKKECRELIAKYLDVLIKKITVEEEQLASK